MRIDDYYLEPVGVVHGVMVWLGAARLRWEF